MKLDNAIGNFRYQLPARRSDYRCKFPCRDECQPSFFALFPEHEEGRPNLFADFNAEIGNAVPWHVYHGRSLRFEFPNDATLKDVRKCMEMIAPLCARLCESYSTEWDGNNMVGKWDPELRERIQAGIDGYFGIERY